MEAEFSRIEIIGSMSKVSAFIEMLSSKHIKEIHKLGISGITVYNAMAAVCRAEARSICLILRNSL